MLASWVIEEMKDLDLQDKRLNERLGAVLDMLGQRPNASIPAALDGGHTETTAAYRLFDNSKVGFENILASHINATFERVSQQPTIVLVQDTTEVDLTRPEQQVKGAGLLDGHARYGEFLHPLMGFTPDGTPLGTMYAQIWTRDVEPKPQEETGAGVDRKHIPIEEKESVRWLETQRYAQEVAQEIPQTQFIQLRSSESIQPGARAPGTRAPGTPAINQSAAEQRKHTPGTQCPALIQTCCSTLSSARNIGATQFTKATDCTNISAESFGSQRAHSSRLVACPTTFTSLPD
jgi:hypothetical protein